MKKLILPFILLIGFGAFAQDQKLLDETFNEFSRRKGAVAMTINHSLLKMIDVDLDVEEKLKNVKGEISEIRFILFSEEDDGSMLVKTFQKKIKEAGFPTIEIEEQNNDLRVLKIYGEKNKGVYKDVHALIQDNDGRVYFFSLKGHFKVEECN